ncbi:hypothetical protein [Arthrobacter glacialis]|uniref:hypothetical protein n=1 Tax=Arthrobacter glacialis TaxID=1664 RepID=UPI001FAED8DE|nr:hypothetical protein [Arthrobacter glacialis]
MLEIPAPDAVAVSACDVKEIDMDLQLTGKKAFVSGSAEGIGYAIAKALATEGVDVMTNGRDTVKLSAAVA